jgi:hypothetical protein
MPHGTNATTPGIGENSCEGQASGLATGFGLTVLRGNLTRYR